ILNDEWIESRHNQIKEEGDDCNEDEQHNVEEGYETSLNRENRHVTGVNDPARNQDKEDEEKLENVPIDIARARRLTVGNYKADRADRQWQSIDQLAQR